MDTLKTVLSEHPFAGVGTSLSGYIISTIDFISPILRFLILFFSTMPAISVAYVHYNKARRSWNEGNTKPSKKSSRNSR